LYLVVAEFAAAYLVVAEFAAAYRVVAESVAAYRVVAEFAAISVRFALIMFSRLFPLTLSFPLQRGKSVV
jgi:hypothetical protein